MTRRLIDCVRHSDLTLSHHIAFWEAVEAMLPPGALANDNELGSIWNAPAPAKTAEMLITLAQATAVFGRAPGDTQLADLNACLHRFNITTPARIRHFLAQVGHESGGLRWMLELASGDAYENRTDLGNTRPGDGRKFKGAGALQLTGRYNYQRLADALGDPDVMDGASYVAVRYPFTSAGHWWQQNGMNAVIDSGATVRQVSARVNGRDPANGIADREAFYARAVAAVPLGLQLQQGLQPPSAERRKQWVSTIKALNLSQPDAYTCQAACIGMAVGDGNIAGIRQKLLARGAAGDPAVMGHIIRSYGRPYRYEGNASLAQCFEWLKQGEFLITHGWFTGSGHVICLDGLRDDGSGCHSIDVKDPWSEFNAPAWAYNTGSKFYDGFYSDLLIYATCVAGVSSTDAKRVYQAGKVDASRGGMWVHRFTTS